MPPPKKKRKPGFYLCFYSNITFRGNHCSKISKKYIDLKNLKTNTFKQGDLLLFFKPFFVIYFIIFRAANVLTGPCKLKAGDVAIVILPRVPEWWVINISAIRAGRLY